MHAVAIGDEMVAEAASGGIDAQARLFDLLSPQVRIMVNARLNPTTAQSHIAEDIVQESLLALRESIGTLQRRTASGLRAFASTIVSRHVADALRDRQRAIRRGNRSLDSKMQADFSGATPLWAMLSASGASPLTQADQADLVPRVMNVLESLKPEHRQVITLAFFDQLETADIAVQMKISRPAASMLLIRAMKSLRRGMTGSSQVMTPTDVQSR
jgi:RNA polymerase sigma factor (sigma-70 family)